MTDRRAFLAAALAAPIVIAAPALAAASDPVTAYWIAVDAYNADRISEAAFLQSVDNLDDWQPRTAADFTRKCVAVFDAGIPPEESLCKLARDARRIAGPGKFNELA